MSSTAEIPATEPGAPTGHDNRWTVLAIVCFGQLMVVLDATIVNVALPVMQADLQLSDANLQWVINAYTLIFGGFLLLGGRLGDIIGRRSVLVAGLAIFTVASLLNGLAANETQLIAARGLQGLGGALLSPAALAIIATEFQGAERAKALAVWGAIAGAGAALGLLLGGVILEVASWHWIFYVNIPIGIGVIIAARMQIAQSKSDEEPSHDVLGAITATAGLVLLVFTIVRAEQDGWVSQTTLLRLLAAAALLIAFVLIERRHRDPLVPLGIFRLRNISAANSIGLLAFGAIFAQFFFLTLFMQQVRGFEPLQTGLAFLPFSATVIVTSGVAAQVVPRIGVRRSAVLGTGLGMLGLGLFALFLDVDTSYFPFVIGPMIVLAMGMGFTFVPLTYLATAKVGARQAGLASGLFNTTQQVGGALGLAILATIATDHTSSLGGPISPENVVAGWQRGFIVGALMLALACVAAFWRVRDEDVDLSGDAPAPAVHA